MLCLLQIKNFALVDQLTLEFGEGLNVLTGETGAGKSIILDAIDIVLGGKVNNRLIRQGTQQASLEATFKANSVIIEWLQQQEIDPLEDGNVVCWRELSFTGETLRSRCRINGVLVNLQLMGQLREKLVEITAQGQTVQLMDATRQRELLDLYGGNAILKQRKRVESAYEAWQLTKKNLEKRRQSQQERLQKLDLLNYQFQELEDAQLTDEQELDILEQERDRLSHVVELQQLSYQTYQLLYQNDSGEPAIADRLAEAENLLTEMTKYDNQIESILEIIQSALTQVVEAGQQINGYGESLEADPQKLMEVEERINLLKRICRKYGPNLEEVIAYQEKIQKELAELTDSEQSLEQLEKEENLAQEILVKTCQELSQLRQKAAIKLEKQLVKELKPLAMDKVVFVCQITPSPLSITGSDKVIFYFSPNPGEKIQPLASSASGGEMSRFLLALKASLSASEGASQTLVFDEIDAGVSGKVARTIAEKLHKLSQKQQILCVTHQPLVAAMADSHFRVCKQIIERSDENDELNLSEIRTVVRVEVLDNHDTRREELAQLTAGDSAGDAIAFAESILAAADAHRSSNKM